MIASLSTLVLAAAGALYIAVIGPVSPAEQVRAALDNADSRSETLADASRDSDREMILGEDGEIDPTPAEHPTPPGPVVNGRVQPEPVDPPQSGDGSYVVVTGNDLPAPGDGDVVRYLVEVERGMPFDADEFAAAVHTILTDPRGWESGGELRFERVDEGEVAIRVSLSSAEMTDQQCAPLRTLGRVSCWNGSRAVINAERWGMGSDTYGEDLLAYREYVISHEVGHGLGHGHESCSGEGKLAHVMVQQTKSLEGCAPNPWPYPS